MSAGVSKDLVQAHMWLGLAAASGNKDAADNRRKAETLLTKEQVAGPEKRTLKWYEARRGAKP